MAADDIVGGRRRAAIDDDRQVEAVVLIERDGGEMAGRAELRGRERPLVGTGLGRGDDLGKRFLRAVVGDDVNERRIAGKRDRREIGDRIVGRILKTSRATLCVEAWNSTV